MGLTIISGIINILLITAFIIDRVFRLKSIKEFKEAKQAQIENLKQQLEIERTNNDVIITEMHKKRYESLKIILDEKETEIGKNKALLLDMQTALDEKNKNEELAEKLNDIMYKHIEALEDNFQTLYTDKIAMEAERETLN
jgi:hypothetical protein